ncbi:hypothetical protein GCM10010503_39870 [Streptomyces lucensis JCM 4490]|uniref:Uncharacterized protein n=1 Tax=Streptomyces lucensis JCM 4490 TaxID=1306176 RepID=A0A918J8W8_9ACTN|nr:hypothetical protein GCM10010503_39870 [Streptomyces lucensis JCM 4490]
MSTLVQQVERPGGGAAQSNPAAAPAELVNRALHTAQGLRARAAVPAIGGRLQARSAGGRSSVHTHTARPAMPWFMRGTEYT